MPRYFTQYWNWKKYQDSLAIDGETPAETLLDHTAGALFTRRGVKPGDVVYVVSGEKGRLYLVGKMEVGEILLSTADARSRIGYEPWPAPEHLIARGCTPVQLKLELSTELIERLRFISSSGRARAAFVRPGVLDRQTFRAIRELEPESAWELDSLLPQMTTWSRDTPSAWGRWAAAWGRTDR